MTDTKEAKQSDMTVDSGDHTIVLMQPTKETTSRTYYDYESTEAAMDGICQLFEHQLKQKKPKEKKITYDISDLYTYLDGLFDLSCLIYSNTTNTYVPHNRSWIRDEVYNHLKRQAGGGASS
eukprot:TRINITY_DN9685_c0_g1_i1.p1 TRINITY_DN9685_c0_g1~~TRINITY_DN9685_c0_g1_i1.p1  ORF type:complete len:140 (+),score=13.29 TRINITY_DN9685_c0_g1_i1:56-421(+)